MTKIKTYFHAVIVVVLTLFHFQTAAASKQKIDSILSVNAQLENPKELTDNYNILSSLFVYSNIDSSLYYAEKAFDLALKADYSFGKAKALFQISYCFDQSGEWEAAIGNLEQAIKIFEELNDTTFLIASNLNMGILYSYGSDLIKGLEHIVVAKDLAQASNSNYGLPEAFTNIGWYYEYLEEYRSAYNYYSKALELSEENNELDFICVLNIGLGYLDIKLQRFDEALGHFNKARDLVSGLEDEYIASEVNISFASYYIETDQLDKAQEKIQESGKRIEEQNFERLRPDFYAVKGKLLLKQKKYTEALKNLDLSLEYCNKLKKYDIIKDIYADKTEAHAKLGQYQKAYQMFQLQNKTNELIQPNKIAQVLGEFEHKELLKEQSTQLQLQEKLAEEQNKANRYRERVRLQITAFFMILLVVIVIILSYYAILRKKHAAILKQNYNTINKQKLLLESNIQKLAEDEKKLQQLNATKDKFFSIIAHDLKNPFNVMIGISDLIRTNSDTKLPKEFQELVEGMFQTATSGYNLLENLLEWSRTQTDNIQFNPKNFNIHEAFSANEILFRQSASAKNIVISWPQKSDKQVVFADYNMVNFVIRNLLNNAIKFSHKEGKIEVVSQLENEQLVCTVRDGGIGMNDETLNKLFKIEYSVQRDGTAHEKGTGLGLILCKEFVEKNGGQIWVESQEDKGSSFSFSLPLAGA